VSTNLYLNADGTYRLDIAAMVNAKHSLFVAVPSPGEVESDAKRDLGLLSNYMSRTLIPYTEHSHNGNSLVPLARCIMAEEFLKSGCSHLLFIDADQTFRVEDPLRMMAANLDICGAAVAKKKMTLPQMLNQTTVDDLLEAGTTANYVANGLGEVLPWAREVQRVGTGFMMVKRTVFLKIMERNPELKFMTKPEGDADKQEYLYNFFPVGVRNRRYYGEDYGFCDLARDAGCRIWVDRVARVGHIGKFTYWCKLP
jgi:hypothetical protein